MIDLHCDLLACIECSEGQLGFDSPEIRCSVSQLRKGGLSVQTLAVATITGKGSAAKGERQVALYKELLRKHSSHVAKVGAYGKKSGKTDCIFSIENASTLVEEDEPLEKAFERFEAFSEVEKILYVSLTWNDENRFGGGNAAPGIGLKEDGKKLLTFLHGKKTYIDLSHTSDRLAEDILVYIDANNLDLIPIASHSNARASANIPRNLPDYLIKEIVARGGVIGLNLVKRFVGNVPESIFAHIEHIYNLGGENALCLGADYYGGVVFSPELAKAFGEEPFFPTFANAGTMQAFKELLETKLSCEQSEKLFFKNAWQRIEYVL